MDGGGPCAALPGKINRGTEPHSGALKRNKERNMQKARKTWKRMAFLSTQVLLVFSGGACLPDNIFAETAGEIVNGLILTGINLALANSGIQI